MSAITKIICRTRKRLYLCFPPAGSRGRIFWRCHHRHPGRRIQRHRTHRLDRRSAVLWWGRSVSARV